MGQKNNKELIENGGLDNANFIIIKGPVGYGKTYLTKYIANHYGLNYVLLDNKVETVRELVENSDKNNNCLYHLKDFDKSSPAAKSALLKIAEETPKGIKIVITTSAYNFLETLTSRAYIMNIQPYFEEEILEYNVNLMLEQGTLDILQKEFHMILTPTILYNYKQREDINDIIEMVRETIEYLNNGLKLESISKLANNFWKEDRDKVKIYISTLIKAHRLINKGYFPVLVFEKTLYQLDKITISNYRQLIHNMFMELV